MSESAKITRQSAKTIGDQFWAEFLADVKWPRPIPVTERLPDEYVTVLAFDGFGEWQVVHRNGEGDFCTSLGSVVQFTQIHHWLPLPPAPEGTSEA